MFSLCKFLILLSVLTIQEKHEIETNFRDKK